MRSRAAKYFLLLTGLLMLSLSAVPHHHHGNHIHFAVTECASDGCGGCHDACESGSHQSETDTNCEISQLFVISARNEMQQVECPCDHGDDHQALDHFVAILLYFTVEPELSDTGTVWLKYPPYVEPLGTTAGGHTFALRAPPAFIA